MRKYCKIFEGMRLHREPQERLPQSFKMRTTENVESIFSVVLYFFLCGTLCNLGVE
jgi:hypothetical protein